MIFVDDLDLGPDLEPIGKEEGLNTARAVRICNDLFDSVNGSSHVTPDTPPLRTPVTANSPHHLFWQNAIRELKMMRFIDPITLSDPKNPCYYSISSWIMTLEGFQRLWKEVQARGFTELQP